MDEPKAGQTFSPNANRPEQGNTHNAKQEHEPVETAPASQWKFSTEDGALSAPSAPAQHQGPVQSVSWSASEFIAHKKTILWYLVLAVGTIILATIIFLLTHDKISTGVIIFVALVFGFFAGRKPRTLDYKLDDGGISIGSKFYNYNGFKSFSVVDDGAFSSILLLPLKRFMPAISIYYDPKDEERITNILADRLPFEDRKHDVVDSFMHRIRF